MGKRFIVAWIVLFVVWMLGSFLVHGLLLAPEYRKLANLFRPEADAQNYFLFMLLAHVILAGAFAWIYARGVEAKPWLAQGLRYGLAIAFLTVIPMYTIYYAVQPMPGAMVIKQIIFDGILLLVLGAVVAFFYRDGARAS